MLGTGSGKRRRNTSVGGNVIPVVVLAVVLVLAVIRPDVLEILPVLAISDSDQGTIRVNCLLAINLQASLLTLVISLPVPVIRPSANSLPATLPTRRRSPALINSIRVGRSSRKSASAGRRTTSACTAEAEAPQWRIARSNSDQKQASGKVA